MGVFQVVCDDTLDDSIIDAVCATYNRPEKIVVDGKQVDNPVSKRDFTNNILCSFVTEVASSYEARVAAETQRVATLTAAKQKYIVAPDTDKLAEVKTALATNLAALNKNGTDKGDQ